MGCVFLHLNLAKNFEHYGSNIVVRNSTFREGQQTVEDKVERLRGRPVATLGPHFPHLGGTEFDFVAIAQLMKTVGGEQDAVSSSELHHMALVGGVGKHSGRQ